MELEKIKKFYSNVSFKIQGDEIAKQGEGILTIEVNCYSASGELIKLIFDQKILPTSFTDSTRRTDGFWFGYEKRFKIEEQQYYNFYARISCRASDLTEGFVAEKTRAANAIFCNTIDDYLNFEKMMVIYQKMQAELSGQKEAKPEKVAEAS